jgi:hypothetical protein
LRLAHSDIKDVEHGSSRYTLGSVRRPIGT